MRASSPEESAPLQLGFIEIGCNRDAMWMMGKHRSCAFAPQVAKNIQFSLKSTVLQSPRNAPGVAPGGAHSDENVNIASLGLKVMH